MSELGNRSQPPILHAMVSRPELAPALYVDGNPEDLSRAKVTGVSLFGSDVAFNPDMLEYPLHRRYLALRMLGVPNAAISVVLGQSHEVITGVDRSVEREIWTHSSWQGDLKTSVLMRALLYSPYSGEGLVSVTQQIPANPLEPLDTHVQDMIVAMSFGTTAAEAGAPYGLSRNLTTSAVQQSARPLGYRNPQMLYSAVPLVQLAELNTDLIAAGQISDPLGAFPINMTPRR